MLLAFFVLLRKCRSHLSRTYFVAALPQYARRGIFRFKPTTPPSIAQRRDNSPSQLKTRLAQLPKIHHKLPTHFNAGLGAIIRNSRCYHTPLPSGQVVAKNFFSSWPIIHTLHCGRLTRSRPHSITITPEDEPPCSSKAAAPLRALCFRSLIHHAATPFPRAKRCCWVLHEGASRRRKREKQPKQ